MNMRKLILFFILCLLALTTQAQDIIMTKEKHEQLKKNIEDYKHLIIVYDNLKLENQNIKAQLIQKSDSITYLKKVIATCKKCSDPKPEPKKKSLFKRIGESISRFAKKLKSHKFEKNY